MNELTSFLDNMYALFEIPICCFQGNKFIYKPSNDISPANLFLLEDTFRNDLINKWDGEPFLIIENKYVMYGICQDGAGISYLIGPFAAQTLIGNDLYHFKVKHNLLNYNDYKVPSYSIMKAASLLSTMHHILNHQVISYTHIMDTLRSKQTGNNVTQTDLLQYYLENSKESREHLSYKKEKQILSAISNCELELLSTITNDKYKDHLGILAKTPYKHLEYAMISGITLYTRAAIEGGVDPDQAYNLSDLYIQKIAACHNIHELQQISINSKFDFCKQVMKARQHNNGIQYIEMCKRYVTKNLRQKFTLDDIANAIGNNKCYLTHQFSLNEGKSLKRYIQEERIKAAQNMLKYSDLSINEIANHLCFETQSHFCCVFKKITATTPAVYRRQNKIETFR